jgi:hypothetical protein
MTQITELPPAPLPRDLSPENVLMVEIDNGTPRRVWTFGEIVAAVVAAARTELAKEE